MRAAKSTIALLTVCLTSAFALAQEAAQPAGPPGTAVPSSGAAAEASAEKLSIAVFHREMDLKVGDLKVLPHISITVHNSHSGTDENYSGVRLADLLGKMAAPLGNELRGKALADYVVATGSDRYQAVFSLAEVDPSFHPGEVIVADAMNGKALDQHNGPFKLVVSEDKRPARWVRNLVSIELLSAP